MRNSKLRALWWRIALVAVGSTFFLGGCDPQLQATVQNGIITTSTSLLTAVIQAVTQLAAEANP